MRWSIIRLIWLRELRDQLRDRRTVFMIAVLPILLYPLAGFGIMHLALGYLTQQSVVGIAGIEGLHPWARTPPPMTPVRAASWLAFTPAPPGCSLGVVDRLGTAVSFAVGPPEVQRIPGVVAWLAHTPPLPGLAGLPLDRLSTSQSLALGSPVLDYPPLLEISETGRLVFSSRYTDRGSLTTPLTIRVLEEPVPRSADPAEILAPYRAYLDQRTVNLVLVVSPDFQARLQAGQQPGVAIFSREKDESAHLVNLRVSGVLNRWRQDLKEVRLVRQGLAADFDVPFHVQDPEKAKSASRREEENLFTLLVRVFPFVLVMWSLAGALYPAVDLCAGEKERGTMETLLISPASREEIVWGKFLTIWVFSAATALLNLVSMALTIGRLAAIGPGGSFSPWAFFWGVVLLLPLSAFFSALCLAVGAYARSSKEGQYYLMPLFLVTMPLIFLTLAPGVELNPFYSMVPVTGVALLLQKLTTSTTPDPGVWLYFIPVLAPMVIYGWLALRWAIEQFQREEVLFREAERLDLGLWLKRLLREKEALPSAGEALFCFGLILVLRWMSFGVGQDLSLLTRTGIGQLAFVATPPMFMALLLTTRPRFGLGLSRAPWWSWPAAVCLALLVLPPLAELTLVILRQFPALMTLLELNHPLTRELRALTSRQDASSGIQYFLVLAILPAVCEELAFRGFILQGLLRGFRPWSAILLSAFLFSLYQMNVFQFVPHFVFGVVLGFLVVRAGSVLPAMLFHLVYNCLVIAPAVLSGIDGLLPSLSGPNEEMPDLIVPRVLLSGSCTLLAGAGLFLLWRLVPASGGVEQKGGVTT